MMQDMLLKSFNKIKYIKREGGIEREMDIYISRCLRPTLCCKINMHALIFPVACAFNVRITVRFLHIAIHIATTNFQARLINILYLCHVYQYSRFRNETENHAKITCLLNKLTYTVTNLFCFEIFY